MGCLEYSSVKCFKDKFISLISKVSTQFFGYAFVDDTDVIESKPTTISAMPLGTLYSRQ
jgi:hypothetical protein